MWSRAPARPGGQTDMDDIFAILRRPLVTEKSSRLREQNQFVIEVDPRATKGQIRSAIETRYKVQVVNVRTVKEPGKYRRIMGPRGGFQSDRKKAIVRLRPGQQITWEEVS